MKVIIIEDRILNSAQYTKRKFSIKDLSSECGQIRSFLMIWSHLLEKSFKENFIFCAVALVQTLMRMVLIN